MGRVETERGPSTHHISRLTAGESSPGFLFIQVRRDVWNVWRDDWGLRPCPSSDGLLSPPFPDTQGPRSKSSLNTCRGRQFQSSARSESVAELPSGDGEGGRGPLLDKDP